jgi:hypothetical protein
MRYAFPSAFDVDVKQTHSEILHRVCWLSGNVLDSYSGDAGFESWPEHRLYLTAAVFEVSLDLPRQIPGLYLD